MSWDVEYIPEAETDMDRLDGSQRKMVLKAIDKVAKNPLPVDEGGYGKPLGNKHGNNLSGLLKIKLLKLGIRIRKESAIPISPLSCAHIRIQRPF